MPRHNAPYAYRHVHNNGVLKQRFHHQEDTRCMDNQLYYLFLHLLYVLRYHEPLKVHGVVLQYPYIPYRAY